MFRPCAALATLLLTATALAGPPAAAPAPQVPAVAAPVPNADKLVSYRKTVMGSMGSHMKAAGMIARGDVARPQDLPAHAHALQAAGAEMTALFPAGTGSDTQRTEAKADVWARPAEFQAAVAAYQSATADLVTAADAGDLAAVSEALGKVGRTCGGCHDGFKIKD